MENKHSNDCFDNIYWHFDDALEIYLKRNPINKPDNLNLDEFDEGIKVLEKVKNFSAVHMGMYMTWIIKNNMIGEIHLNKNTNYLKSVCEEKMTGTEFILNCCCSKILGCDFNEEGLNFTKQYYDKYINKFSETCILIYNDIYCMEDTWDNYKIVENILSQIKQ